MRVLWRWIRAGAQRRDLTGNGTYEHSGAVRTLDALWPRLVAAQFRPVLGPRLFRMAPLRDHPPPGHGAYETHDYGRIAKDLRTLLGRPVRGRYSRIYCGRGRLGRCRGALIGALREALAHRSDEELYPDGPCEGGDAQWCHDADRYDPVGAIEQPLSHFQNRPTFQQVIEIRGR